MTEHDRHAVPLGDNLSRSRDRQVGMRLPMAVDEKLDRLRDAAQDAGDGPIARSSSPRSSPCATSTGLRSGRSCGATGP